jgi:hypothetical protein
MLLELLDAADLDDDEADTVLAIMMPQAVEGLGPRFLCVSRNGRSGVSG